MAVTPPDAAPSLLRAALQVSNYHWQDEIPILRGEHPAVVNSASPVGSRASVS